LVLLDWSVPALGWGERGHQIINAAAVENLPEPLRSYFRARKAFLVEYAIDPDRQARNDPEERPHHFTDADGYDAYPFEVLRQQFVEERLGPPPAQLNFGDSIWQIERFTLKLADDFRRQRWEDADHDAVYAAHYAGDLVQPLHTVLNYDGQLTNQQGIHERFETELVNALADGWVLESKPAVNESDLRARIFRELVESYANCQVIFAADNIAVFGRSYLDPQYSVTFRNLAGRLARKRLEAGASFISSLWYTAWHRAGKPALQRPPREVKSRVPVAASPWGTVCDPARRSVGF
jgi:hypothetical protein